MTPISPVDQALEESNPAKDRVRAIWVEKFQAASSRFDGVHPIFLTLSGSRGHDIAALVEAGLIGLNEVKGIDETDLLKVVAIESKPQAVAQLQREFPGLKIIEKDVASLVRSEGHFAWPEGDERQMCAASVINLDFNGALLVRDQEPTFPQIEWITKLARIQHMLQVNDEWTLCLTLNAGRPWSDTGQLVITGIMNDNGSEHPQYRNDIELLLVPDLVDAIDQTTVLPPGLSEAEAQYLLCLMVPKLVAEALVPVGWSVETEHSLSYIGGGGAPMVTFVMEVVRATPGRSISARLSSAISGILDRIGSIAQDGTLQTA